MNSFKAGRAAKTIKAGYCAHGSVTDSDRHYDYVTNFYGDRTLVIKTESMTVIARTPVGKVSTDIHSCPDEAMCFCALTVIRRDAL